MKVENQKLFDEKTQRNIDLWLNGQYDEETKQQIRKMIQEDPRQASDAFFTNLQFGTGGMRGLMGIGTNRMNVYTIRAATQGLANYMHKNAKKGEKLAAFIGYDSRENSRLFAEEAAKVLAGNGIRVYLSKELRPTPYVSFGCRFKQCLAAIMITASHNPPQYNGYKVYWGDGGQLVPPHDGGVVAEANLITDPSMVKKVSNLKHLLIEEVSSEVDEAYFKAITPLQYYPDVNKREGNKLKIVYTSLHGTGITLLPKALSLWGFKNIVYVDKQIIPDGAFPTVKFPNPEDPQALQMGIDLMVKTQADILIATDPDADRVGVVAMHQNQPVILNGNQIAVLCLEHVCQALSKKEFPKRAAFIKTVATTELFQTICDFYRHPCFNVLIGFKYIAEKIHEWEVSSNGYQYIFGGEESFGYLLGTYARDKDAIISSALICELALQAKLEGKTIIDKLEEMHHKYGLYQERLLSLNFGETKEGKEEMSRSMHKLREAQLKEIGGVPVSVIEDYISSERLFLETGKKEKMTLPRSDILVYWLTDGSKLMVRPSGTEPKVKLYCGVVEKKFTSVKEASEKALKKCDKLLDALKKAMTSKDTETGRKMS